MASKETQRNALKVMVVGDSISHGREGDWTWRYRIWEWFRDQDIPVSFVGPYSGTVPADEPAPPRPPPLVSDRPRRQPLRTDGGYAAGVAPEFLANSNHYAAGGWQASQAKMVISGQITDCQPDFCFVQLGFNDLGWRVTGPSDTLASVKTLIDRARLVKPDLKFAVANVPHRTDLPGRQDLPLNTDIYNAMLARAIPKWSSQKSPVALVRFCENYSCGGTNSEAAYDGLHPNALGEYQLAQAFSRTLISVFSLGQRELTIPEDIPPRPLPTPTNFTAVSAPSGIVATWDAVYGAFGYELRVRLVGSPEWQTRHVPCNRYDTRHCFKDQAWEYQVRASGGDSLKSPWSSVVSAVANPQTAPGPRNIVAHSTRYGFSASWDAPEGQFVGKIDRYGVIYRDEDVPGSFPCVVGVKGESADIEGLVPGHRYSVAIETWTDIGGGPPAGAGEVTVGRGPPPVPQSVRAVAISEKTVEIRWDGHPSATEYSVMMRQMSPDGKAMIAKQDPRNPRFYFNSSDPPPWEFKFAVASTNTDGTSPRSEWVHVSPFKLPQPVVRQGDSIRIHLQCD